MTLRDWITAAGGIDAARRKVGVSKQQLYAWLAHRQFPSAKNWIKLKRASSGQLNYETLVAAHLKAKKRTK
jgi:hypothetical protein